MKSRIAAVVLICLWVLPRAAYAEPPCKPVMSIAGIKLATLEDGKPTGIYHVVDLDIQRRGDTLEASWREVVIMPSYDGEKTILRARHLSTVDGTLTNLTTRGNDASFQLLINPRRKISVLCHKTGPLITDYEITATTAGQKQSGVEEKKIDWVTVKGILMPSKNVW